VIVLVILHRHGIERLIKTVLYAVTLDSDEIENSVAAQHLNDTEELLEDERNGDNHEENEAGHLLRIAFCNDN